MNEKQNDNLKKYLPLAGGFCTGVLNGLFGAGGGMVAVPFLRSGGLDEKQSHASSVALLMALSFVSTMLYLRRGSMTIQDALPYLPGALAGSAAGALLMPKISTKWLKRIFGLLMIYGGIRMVVG